MKPILSLPLVLFLVIFFYLPFAILAYYSVHTGHEYTIENYLILIRDKAFLIVIYKSIILALEVTLATLILSYPAAAYISFLASYKEKILLLGLFVIPFWIDILLRALALKTLLYSLGIREGYGAMLIGMIYDYLPLMFIPVYASMQKISRNIIHAARTTGASTIKILISIIIPLTVPGIVAGVMLVFLMSLTEFVIPALLGGVEGFTVGSLIYYLFLSGGMWGVGAALTVVLVVSLAVLTVITSLRVEGDIV